MQYLLRSSARNIERPDAVAGPYSSVLRLQDLEKGAEGAADVAKSLGYLGRLSICRHDLFYGLADMGLLALWQVERATRSFLPGEQPKDVLVPHDGILRGHFSLDVGHAYDVEPSHIL